ncbi:hypothetical protein R1flu_023037 [Riccia fluitans]|uniref:BTB domain-containing protein n=1 Tax=Riccia fluitans TaxID=41844 RepID=A0ABD1XQW5_9MARC
MNSEALDLTEEATTQTIHCAKCGCSVRVNPEVFSVRKKQKTKARKLRFLQMLDPDPRSENFRGDVALIGVDKKAVYAHRFILVYWLFLF